MTGLVCCSALDGSHICYRELPRKPWTYSLAPIIRCSIRCRTHALISFESQYYSNSCNTVKLKLCLHVQPNCIRRECCFLFIKFWHICDRRTLSFVPKSLQLIYLLLFILSHHKIRPYWHLLAFTYLLNAQLRCGVVVRGMFWNPPPHVNHLEPNIKNSRGLCTETADEALWARVWELILHICVVQKKKKNNWEKFGQQRPCNRVLIGDFGTLEWLCALAA